MPVLDILASKRGFTASEAELADYILEHADEVARMGLSDLSAAAYKSNATIIRLARKAGSSGWRDFRIDLAADLEKRRRDEKRVDPNAPFEGKPSTAAIMSSIATLEHNAIIDCYARVNPEAVGTFARATVQARRIMYYALGDSYASAFVFGALMSKIGVSCVPADQYRFRHEASFHVGPQDLALIISYSGDYLDELGDELARMRERHCKIAVITSDERITDAFPSYDYPIVLPKRENRLHKVATFYSQTCIRYVLNCIYSVAFAQNYDTNLTAKDFMEKLEPDGRIFAPRR